MIKEMNRRLADEAKRGERELSIQVERISKDKWFLKVNRMRLGVKVGK